MNLLAEPDIRLHVRWAIRRDMAEIIALDTANLDPWGEEDFLRELRRRSVIGMVAERGERVVGFMVYELHKAHLLLLRMGGAHGARLAMFEKLRSKLGSHRRTAVEAAVDEYDDAMIAACRDAGLLAEGVSRIGGRYHIEFAYRIQEDAWTF